MYSDAKSYAILHSQQNSCTQDWENILVLKFYLLDVHIKLFQADFRGASDTEKCLKHNNNSKFYKEI